MTWPKLRWHQFRKRAACPHSDLLALYGDAVNYAGGHRLICATCGRLIDGPVVLSAARRHENDPGFGVPIGWVSGPSDVSPMDER